MIILTIIQTAFILFSFAYTMRRLKRCEPISWRVRKGAICYSCNASLCDSEEDEYSRIFSSDAKDLRLCARCSRDERLSATLGGRRIYYLNRLKRLCHSEKSHRISMYFMAFMFFGIFASLALNHFFHTDIFNLLPFTGNIIYWSFFLYRSKITLLEKGEAVNK
jgi:hypothetical protein